MHDASILQRVERAAALGDLKLFGRESRQFFITSWLLLHGNMGSIFARCYNKWPLRPQTKKSNRNFTVTGMSMSCLDGARTANLGTEIRLHLANKGSWKAGSPTSNPLVLKAKSRQFFIALWLYMETWGRPRKMPQQIALETTNQKIYSKQLTVTGMTCLDPARISNLDAEYLRRKIIRIHHWFTTQTSILTMFELDCDSWLNKSPLPTLWTPNEFNVLAKNGGDGFLK